MKFLRILLIILLLTTFGCIEKTNLYYPNKDWFENKDSLIKIEHRTINFEQLRNAVSNIYQKEKVPYVEIYRGDTIRKVIPLPYDGYGHYNNKNFTTITKDSVFTMIDDEKIDQLQSIMMKQYSNNGKNPQYAQNIKSVLMIIDAPMDENGIEIEKLILRLIKTFNKVNAKFNNALELYIAFAFRRAPPPPPPPPIN